MIAWWWLLIAVAGTWLILLLCVSSKRADSVDLPTYLDATGEWIRWEQECSHLRGMLAEKTRECDGLAAICRSQRLDLHEEMAAKACELRDRPEHKLAVPMGEAPVTTMGVVADRSDVA